jgi:transformation/transcription domain-associated protein
MHIWCIKLILVSKVFIKDWLIWSMMMNSVSFNETNMLSALYCFILKWQNMWLVSVADATITPHTLNFVKKLVSTFGVGIENVSSVTTTFSSAASESLARRAQATAQDPVFQKMKCQFTTDFDFR